MSDDTANNNSAEVIVFYHLPKSGGTTLNAILKRNYPAEAFVECGPDTHAFVAELKTWPAERLAAIRLLQGHFPFGLHDLLPQPARCFTLLRDPIERVISYYYHARRDRAHYLYDLIHDNDWSLADLLASGTALMMNDGQVRLLSAVWGDAPFGGVDESMLAKAIANLRACDMVGVTEQFDRTLILLQREFGWRHIGYARANIGHNRPATKSLSAETIAAVRDCNQMDALLYEEARRLFAERVGDFGPSLGLRQMALDVRKRFAE